MEVSSPLYMPVLKWKAGEQAALKALDQATRDRMIPLIELRSYSTAITASLCAGKLKECWDTRALFDCAGPDGILTHWRLTTFDDMVAFANAKSVKVIPVVNPDDAVFQQPARSSKIAKCPLGIALRLRVKDVTTIGNLALAAKLAQAAAKWRISHVVVDLGVTPTVTNHAQLVSELNALVSDAYETHVVSGAYPNGYQQLAVGLNLIPRRDWLLWTDLHAKHNLSSSVGYGDFTVVAPDWEDKSGSGGVPTAYRYADSAQWLIYKGTSNQGSESFSISQLLVKHPAFRGASCCLTDRTVIARATAGAPTKTVRPGGPKDHISEGVLHHLTLVTREQYP